MAGCAYKGTATCLVCPYADEVELICNYECRFCPDVGCCPCSVTGQEVLVDKALERAGVRVRELADVGGVESCS